MFGVSQGPSIGYVFVLIVLLFYQCCGWGYRESRILLDCPIIVISDLVTNHVISTTSRNLFVLKLPSSKWVDNVCDSYIWRNYMRCLTLCCVLWFNLSYVHFCFTNFRLLLTLLVMFLISA